MKNVPLSLLTTCPPKRIRFGTAPFQILVRIRSARESSPDAAATQGCTTSWSSCPSVPLDKSLAHSVWSSISSFALSRARRVSQGRVPTSHLPWPQRIIQLAGRIGATMHPGIRQDRIVEVILLQDTRSGEYPNVSVSSQSSFSKSACSCLVQAR